MTRGRRRDLDVLHDLEQAAEWSDGPSITISTNNLKWLVQKAKLWVERGDQNEQETTRV